MNGILCARQSGALQAALPPARRDIGRRAIRYGFKPRGNMGDEDMGKVYIMPNRGRMGSWGNIIAI